MRIRSEAYRIARFALVWGLLVLLFEVFVCNAPSFALWGKTYEETIIGLEDMELTGLSFSEGEWVATEDTVIISFQPDQNVYTLFLDLDFEAQADVIGVEISYADAGHSSSRITDGAMQLMQQVTRSKYTLCQYTGETLKITLTLSVEKGQSFSIQGIVLNSRIPFYFSVLRVGILWGGAVLLYAFSVRRCWRRPFSAEEDAHHFVFWGIVWFSLLGTLALYLFYVGGSAGALLRDSGDQISQELVDAFRHGQVSLLEKPSADLLNLANPYDGVLRYRVSAKWDHVLFNGKYYSYYGIAPVLTLFLPVRLLTGKYLNTAYGVLMYSLLGMIFLQLAYRKIVQKWFRKTPAILVLAGQILLIFTCGIGYNVMRPRFYELAETAAFFFFTLGFFLLLQTDLLGRGHPVQKSGGKVLLTFSGICVSLAVLSRPTYALYAIAMVIWIIWGIVEKRELFLGEKVRILFLGAIPYVLFGGLQMLYNYLRFGSVLEFGIQYSLTINDFTQTIPYGKLIWLSLWTFLFSIPEINSTFPFFHPNLDYWQLNGYYYFESRTAFGLFWRALPLFSLFYIPGLGKGLKKKHLVKWGILAAGPGLLVPVSIIAMTWESGHAMRYNLDFAWPLLLLSFAIIFYIMEKIPLGMLRKWLIRLMIACMVLSIVANMASIFQRYPTGYNMYYQNELGLYWYQRIRSLVQFWM